MFSSIILNEGTSMHTTLQDYLSEDRRAYGMWACRDCGCVSSKPSLRPSVCPQCHSRLGFSYVETPVDYKGFVGHVDFLLKDNDKYYLIDFKSTGGNMAKKIEETPLSYDLQTLSYCLLLRLQYGIRISERALVYVDRNNPRLMKMGCVEKVTKEDLKKIQGILKSQKELLNFLLDCTSFKEYMENVGIQRCPSKYCEFCKMDDATLTRKLKLRFKELNGISYRQRIENEHHNIKDDSGSSV
jgi:hypothetical protein